MKILVLNSGSSTLKFDLLEATPGGELSGMQRLAHGIVDRIGKGSSVEFKARTGEAERQDIEVRDHGEAVAQVFRWLESVRLNKGIGAIGHRVVHGGLDFTAPTRIDDNVLHGLESLNELAPLHNPAAIKGIRAALAVVGPDVPMFAVFDTQFHRTLPDYAHNYAIDHALAERHRVRRYGFHGIAHEYMLLRYSAMSGVPAQHADIITLQLGNGCSACAIKGGQSVDTSMGFTPLEGLVMGTRSGDLDPSIVTYLAAKEGMTAQEIEGQLNNKSGLLGLSGRSSDMRDLLAAAPNDPWAALAIEVFCYRVRKYIGSYMAALGGTQAIIFGGGIGEHATTVRARICEGLQWAGLALDPKRNDANQEGRITPDDAQLNAYIVSVDESVLIARYVVNERAR